MKGPRSIRQKMLGFTLIELLIVISIIALLATIGFVGGSAAIKRARNLEATTVMRGLEAAVRAYQNEYLRLPSADTSPPTEDNQAIDTSDENGRILLASLLGRDRQRNPREQSCWKAPALKSSGAGYSTERGLRDPWGNGYRLIMDYSKDGLIVNPYQGEGEARELSTDVIIYCAGADKTFGEAGSAGGRKVDDVKSWQQ